jgi:hypothetical protein
MPKKIKMIGLYALTIGAMIALISVISSDYILALVYVVVAATVLTIKPERHDYAAYLLGLIGITISEYFFISTGVETFSRISLFGVMPLWLPFLWAFAFVLIKRTLHLLDR